MNYITDGTFWVVVIFIFATIFGVWYNLKKEIDKVKQDLNATRKIIADGAREIGKSYEMEEKARNEEMADVYDTLALLTKTLAIVRKNTDKKTRSEIDKLFADYNKKHANHKD